MFFPEPPFRPALEDRAKQICLRCPVLLECLKYTDITRPPYGTWAGQTQAERRRRYEAIDKEKDA